MEYDRFAQGTLTSTGLAMPVYLPFQPSFIEISNQTRAAAASGVTRAWWLTEMGQGAAMVVTTSGGPADGTSFITTATGTGFTTFQAGLALQYGAAKAVSTITKANPAVVTSTAHGLSTGDIVIFQNLYQTATTGMQQICNVPFVITKTGANTFTIPVNTNQSMFTAYDTSTATVAGTWMKVLYPSLYAPSIKDIVAVTTGTTTTIDTSSPHNLVVGQEVAFRIPSAYGITQLNSLPDVTIPGSPIYGFVTVVNSATEVVVNINSSAFTAFTFPTVAQVLAGLAPAQMLAVGDNNSGSGQFGFNPPLVNSVATINGPAIAGAFLNNTRQGFQIGSAIAGTASDVICWRAYLASIT